MKICAAQTRPVKGDIQGNITNHRKLITQAVSDGAELVIFPELSLTGYEPPLARKLAMDGGDARLDEFQSISDARGIAIGVGAPTRHDEGVCISLLLFQPNRARHVYSKSHLHRDEEPFFVRGRSSPHVEVKQIHAALAICYEISVMEHLDSVMKSPPAIYLASVVKFVNGFDKALARLSGIAREASMPVLMSNSSGFPMASHAQGRHRSGTGKGRCWGNSMIRMRGC